MRQDVGLLRKRCEAAATAGERRRTHCGWRPSPPLWSPLQCASAHHLRFPPFSPSTPPSPSRSRLRGAVNPVRRPEAGHRRRSLRSRKIMYQPTRGAARRLGPCLRAYQARPQVRAEREGRGGEGTLLRAGAGGGACASSAQAQQRPAAAFRLCWAAREGRGVAGGDPKAAQPAVGCMGCGFSRVWAAGRDCISPAFPRLPGPGGDLKDKGRRGSQPDRGAAPEFSGPDQTDEWAASLPLG